MTNSSRKSCHVPTKEEILEYIKTLERRLGREPTRADYYADGPKFSDWQLRVCQGLAGAYRTLGYSSARAKRKNEYRDNPEIRAQLKLRRIENERDSLRGQVEELEKSVLSVDAISGLITTLKTKEFERIPGWLSGVKSEKRTAGIPVAFFSDFHYGEVVHPEQIGYCNEYNSEIAERRFKTAIKNVISLLKFQFVNPKYEGIVFPLGGDMISGTIHEELKDTNDQRVLSCVYNLTQLIINGVGELADAFGKVVVPCVVGNHPRLDKKPRSKFKVEDNLEWLSYMFAADYFKNDSRVTFIIPKSADAQFNIFDQKILLTHGDQFRGGNGIAGIFSPIMRGKAQKRERQQAIKKPFDVIMMGHWHRLLIVEDMIVNGSIKGYDEYASNSNFSFERPQQALVIVHRDHGLTHRMPILCDESTQQQKR